MPPTLEQLRRYAIARSLFKPTTLRRAIRKLGFVQADPIRAPARAQDLTLRHRVIGYRAGDLERRYSRLGIEEDYFVNYGYLLREHHRLMHPRKAAKRWSPARNASAQELLAFIRERGTAHPRVVDRRFEHGKTLNWFGGATNATTRLLDEMHYRGLLRVARRDSGTRVYAAREPDPNSPAGEEITARIDTLVDLIVGKYAPLPARSLTQLLRFLSGGIPQWSKHRAASLERTKRRLASTRIDGIDWYWPVAEVPAGRRWRAEPLVRLLTPFDPVVWDRHRFELFWGWQYRFEAYTPAAKRKLGYYALPLLWGERVIGWGNLTYAAGSLESSFGYVAGGPPREAAYRTALEAELERMRIFLSRTAD
jgi:uncharacterized protein